MTTTTATAPNNRAVQAPVEGVNYSTRVDKVGRRAQTVRAIRIGVVILVAIVGLIPIYWMGTTAFKTRADAVATPPKVLFKPTFEGFINLLTDRSILNKLRQK